MAAPNNPTFVRYSYTTSSISENSGSSPGYYSRTMFSFVGQTANLTNSWASSSNENGLENLYENNSGSCWGSYVFPPYYWRDGKMIRMKGTFYVSASSSDKSFNMRLGIDTIPTLGSGFTVLARTNDGNNHLIGQGELIVNFESIIACSTANSGSAGECVFVANGFYSENTEGYQESQNRKNATWTQVWKSTNQGFTVTSSAYYVSASSPWIDLYPSAVTGSINLLHLSIEELA